MSEFRFAEAYPASPGFGKAMSVTTRAPYRHLGYVRRVRGENQWMVYRPDGSELGVADMRTTAANWLKREADRTAADAPETSESATKERGDG